MESGARHILAPAGGAAALLGALFAVGTGPTGAIVIGGLVWGGLALMLMPRDRTKALRDLLNQRVGKQSAEEIAAKLAEAKATAERLRGRVRALERAGTASESVRGRLLQIAAQADQLIHSVAKDPGDFGRVRKPLFHYLPHADEVAERLVDLDEQGGLKPALVQRADGLLDELEHVMEKYHERSLAAETLDLDVRIEVLEKELKAEGAR